MARKRLENRPRLGADAEGVALSAFDSFFRGAEADYDDLCRIYRDRLRNSANSIDVNLLAWAWCIGPHETSELEWIIQKTEASLSMPLPPIERITMLNTLGALFYRAGRFENAIEKIEESIKNRGDRGVIEDWLFLTMAHQRLGNADKARDWLEMSRIEIEKTRQSMKQTNRKMCSARSHLVSST